MRVLGIDPGTATLGWGVVAQEGGRLRTLGSGAVRTSPGKAAAERLAIIYDEVRTLIGRFEPDRAAVEELFFGHNVNTAIAVGQARGVVLLALAQAGLAVTELKPAEVKMAVAGYGKADKIQVGRMVARLLGLDTVPRPDDVADALAIAVTACEYARFDGAVRARDL